MAFLSRDLGIDLGTINLVIAEGGDILLQEPTIVAILVEEQKMVEWGQAARDMLGRVSEAIEVVRPLRNGVIAEFEVTEDLLGFIIKKNMRAFVDLPAKGHDYRPLWDYLCGKQGSL